MGFPVWILTVVLVAEKYTIFMLIPIKVDEVDWTWVSIKKEINRVSLYTSSMDVNGTELT